MTENIRERKNERTKENDYINSAIQSKDFQAKLVAEMIFSTKLRVKRKLRKVQHTHCVHCVNGVYIK